MKIKSIFLVLLLLCSVQAASAQTLSFIDPGLSDDDPNTELLIYYGNGTLAGVLTTNDSLSIDGSTDIVIHKRNKQLSIVDDPQGFLRWIVDTMGYTIIIIVAGVIVGVGILSIAVQAAKGSSAWTKSKSGGSRRW